MVSQNGNGRTAAQDGALMGMKSICAYMGKSESTILRYVYNRDFPAGKVGGEWVSDVRLISDWRADQIRTGSRPKKRRP